MRWNLIVSSTTKVRFNEQTFNKSLDSIRYDGNEDGAM